MTFVYVLGTAKANQRPSPRRKPRASARTCQNIREPMKYSGQSRTKSLTMIPSNRANTMDNTVRTTRKNEWRAIIRASLEFQDGIAIRNKRDRSAWMNVGSRRAFDCLEPWEWTEKYFEFDLSTWGSVSCIGTYLDNIRISTGYWDIAYSLESIAIS